MFDTPCLAREGGGDNVGKGRVENSTNGVSRSLSKGESCIMSGMFRAGLCLHFIHPKVISICIYSFPGGEKEFDLVGYP